MTESKSLDTSSNTNSFNTIGNFQRWTLGTMADCAAARRDYDSAYQRFEAEIALLKDHRKRFEVANPAKRSLSSRINRWSVIAQLPIQTMPTLGMRLQYASMKGYRDHYIGAMDAGLRAKLERLERAREAQSMADWTRLNSPTHTVEDWRRRHLPLLCGIQHGESEAAAMDIQITFLSSQTAYLVEEKQRADQVYENLKGFPHKTFFGLFETSTQDNHNIEDALQHRNDIGEQLTTIRAMLWQEVDKRKHNSAGLQTYIGTVEMFLRRAVQEAQLSETKGELTERAVHEAKAQHNLSVFMHEQAAAIHDRTSRLLIDVKAIWKIESVAGDSTSAPVIVASDYLDLIGGRAKQAERDLRKAKGNSDITAAALREALANAAAEAERKYASRRARTSAYQPPAPRPTATEWIRNIDLILSNYAKIQSFPEPPAIPCIRSSCRSQHHTRALKVCDCAIRAAFANVSDLRRERTRWHPDKWSCCRADRRELFEKKAGEMFVVLDAMYKEAKAKMGG